MKSIALVIVCLISGYACKPSCDSNAQGFAWGMCLYYHDNSMYGFDELLINDTVDTLGKEFHVDMSRLLARHDIRLSIDEKISRVGAIGLYSPQDKEIHVQYFKNGNRPMMFILVHELLHFMEDVYDIPSEESMKHTNRNYFGELNSLEITIAEEVYEIHGHGMFWYKEDNDNSNQVSEPID